MVFIFRLAFGVISRRSKSNTRNRGGYASSSDDNLKTESPYYTRQSTLPV